MSTHLVAWPPVGIAVLDDSVLDSIREVQEAGAPDLIQETVALFLVSTPERVTALEQAVAKSDSDAIRTSAHAIKGSCWLLGLTRLGKACEALEVEAIRGRLEDASEWLVRIQAEYELATRALRDLNATG